MAPRECVQGPKKWPFELTLMGIFWLYILTSRDPQKGKKSILMGSLVVLDPNDSPKKISSIFGTGCHKVCTCLLNGAIIKSLDEKMKKWISKKIYFIKTNGFWRIFLKVGSFLWSRFFRGGGDFFFKKWILKSQFQKVNFSK